MGKSYKFLLVIIVFILIHAVTHGQSFYYPKIKKRGKLIADFIPPGWRISDSVSGDLQRNGSKDYAIVAEYYDSVYLPVNMSGRIETIKTLPRILFVLLYNRDSTKFRLVEQSNKIMVPKDEHFDPFDGMTIKNQILELNFTIYFGPAAHYMIVYKFGVHGGKVVLIGADTDYFNEATLDYTVCSFNFLTKIWIISQGTDHYGTPRNGEIRHVIKLKRLRTLSEFQEPLTWGVAKEQAL